MNELGQFIKSKRREQGLSLRELADLCGMSHSYIYCIEKGRDPKTKKPISPTIDALAKIARGLNISLDELLYNAGYLKNTLSNHVANLSVDVSLIEKAAADLPPAERANLMAVLTNPDSRKKLLEFASTDELSELYTLLCENKVNNANTSVTDAATKPDDSNQTKHANQ